jgi:hypothetical protein
VESLRSHIRACIEAGTPEGFEKERLPEEMLEEATDEGLALTVASVHREVEREKEPA